MRVEIIADFECLDENPSEVVLDPDETVLDIGEAVLDLGETVLDIGEAVLDPGETVLDTGIGRTLQLTPNSNVRICMGFSWKDVAKSSLRID